MNSTFYVPVPPDYYTKAMNDYADWRYAFIREVIQNSSDAKATKIDFTIESLSEGCRIVVCDNGIGMTEEILTTKFLALRQTSKGGDDSASTGAFGVAKEIILFAHKSYKIETGNIVIEGAGGVYTKTYVKTAYSGVRITLEMTDSLAKQMEEKLSYWAAMSKIPAKITLNGKLVNQSSTKFQHVFDVEFGKISFKEDSGSYDSKLIVKLNGMAMFVRTLYTSGSTFMGELDLKGRSIDLLTSNRDGLRNNLESSLSNILDQLANNRSKMTLNEPVTHEFNSIVPFYEEGEKGELEADSHSETDMATDGPQDLQTILDSLGETGLTRSMTKDFAKHLSKIMFKKEYSNQDTKKSKVEDSILKIRSEHLPFNWIIRVGVDNNRSYQKQIKDLNRLKYEKFAHAWRLTVYYVLLHSGKFNAHLDYYGRLFCNSAQVKVGYVLDDVKALQEENGDDIHILINPFLMERACSEDFITLLETAAHECAHIYVQSHGEYFDSTYTGILEGTRRALREDKDLKGQGVYKLERWIKEQIKANI
ncbi:ATP-binding protein [Pseudomonas luteola]